MITSKDFFSQEQIAQIKNAIKEAELNTSGEIRVHIENFCKKDLLDRATDVFKMLKMHKTELRNGVLIYLALSDRKFAIIGDAGINQKVESNFWESIKDEMRNQFSQGNFVEGLCVGIIKSGEKLKTFFPYQKEDINELSNEISYGE
ncbi:MAG: hypothetical protein A2046_16435 [Bacteroidetes bacterium GWA2_30_7]|nr:MAG: hypothetical protein A2046_16435 [Bacteroidetes bacterium GWA2_30_7]